MSVFQIIQLLQMQYFPEPHYLIAVKRFYKYAILAITSFDWWLILISFS